MIFQLELSKSCHSLLGALALPCCFSKRDLYVRLGAVLCCSRNHALYVVALCLAALGIMPFASWRFALLLCPSLRFALLLLKPCPSNLGALPCRSRRKSCPSIFSALLCGSRNRALDVFARCLDALENMPLASSLFALLLSKPCPVRLCALPCCFRNHALHFLALSKSCPSLLCLVVSLLLKSCS